MFRFLIKVSLFVPIAFAVTWVNWHVDPARVFDRHASDPAWYEYERFLARGLRQGEPQRLAAVHNELILDELMFRSLDHLDVLVLGSSSAKPIHKELYAGQSFFNASYFGSRPEEMMALEELARESGLRPRRVVLSLSRRTDCGHHGAAQREQSPGTSLPESARGSPHPGILRLLMHGAIPFPGHSESNPVSQRRRRRFLGSRLERSYESQRWVTSIATRIPRG